MISRTNIGNLSETAKSVKRIICVFHQACVGESPFDALEIPSWTSPATKDRLRQAQQPHGILTVSEPTLAEPVEASKADQQFTSQIWQFQTNCLYLPSLINYKSHGIANKQSLCGSML